MSCFLSSCDITMFVVLWLCHNKPCRFLYIAFPKYKVTDFKMWMVLPGWQIKNLLETNNICGSWYTCTTRLSSHQRAGVENFFSSILVFKFLLNYIYFWFSSNISSRAEGKCRRASPPGSGSGDMWSVNCQTPARSQSSLFVQTILNGFLYFYLNFPISISLFVQTILHGFLYFYLNFPVSRI